MLTRQNLLHMIRHGSPILWQVHGRDVTFEGKTYKHGIKLPDDMDQATLVKLVSCDRAVPYMTKAKRRRKLASKLKSKVVRKNGGTVRKGVQEENQRGEEEPAGLDAGGTAGGEPGGHGTDAEVLQEGDGGHADNEQGAVRADSQRPTAAHGVEDTSHETSDQEV